MKIIFQDIDGPLIPHRMYFNGGRPFDQNRASFIWDPIAVQMVNKLTNKYDAKIVFSTAHGENPVEVLRHQAACNGLMNIHPDSKTNFPFTDNKYRAITEWLDAHPNVGRLDWIVIDDQQVCLTHQVKVHWGVGLTLKNYKKACMLLAGDDVELPKFISHM